MEMPDPKELVTSGRLIAAVAKALHLPRFRVQNYYQAIREDKEGLVTKTGRGANAALMTWADWRTLVFGCASSTATGAPEQVKRLLIAKRIGKAKGASFADAFDKALKQASDDPQTRIEFYVDQGCVEIKTAGGESAVFASMSPAEARKVISRGGHMLLMTQPTMVALLKAYLNPEMDE
jgi:hypothetical protein